ncbi:acyclic terpene utilization AtuA family protein [Rhodococcus koreensis]
MDMATLTERRQDQRKTRTARVGCGSGYALDRLEPAIEVAASGEVDYIAFDTLAERTLAQAQMRRNADPSAGYNTRLPEIVSAMAPFVSDGIKVIGNFGAANVPGALKATVAGLRAAGVRGVGVAAIHGDDALRAVQDLDPEIPGVDRRISDLGDRVVSANFYLGSEYIVKALEAGASWVLGGRIADAALFAAPILHEFGWSINDSDKVAHATLAGHILECSGQATGGYFADPPYREVSGLHRLGYPIAHVRESDMTITKPVGSGGRVDRFTVGLQIPYEVQDPTAYLTPDVTADFSNVECVENGEDRVIVSGARGSKAPDKAKVLVGVKLGHRVTAEIGYAAAGCVERAELAARTHRDAVERFDAEISEIRYELVGVNSMVGGKFDSPTPAEVRMRLAAYCTTENAAKGLAAEFDHLYIHGPAGGGGVVIDIRPTIGVYPLYVDANLVEQNLEIEES